MKKSDYSIKNSVYLNNFKKRHSVYENRLNKKNFNHKKYPSINSISRNDKKNSNLFKPILPFVMIKSKANKTRSWKIKKNITYLDRN